MVMQLSAISKIWIGLVCLLAAATAAADPGPRIRVGIYQNTPKIGLSPEGRPVGFFIDLLEEIARAEGWTLEYVPGTWGEGLDRLAAGGIDLMPDVAHSAEREARFAFHREPVLSDWFQIHARRGSGIAALPDLHGRRIAVLENSIQQEVFAKMARDFELAAILQSYPDYDAAYRALTAGTVDAVIANRFTSIDRYRSAIVETGILFHPTRLFFAAPKTGARARLDAIDRQLARLKQDRTSVYYDSLQRWLASGDPPWRPPAWLKISGGILAGVLLVSLAWSFALQRQVTRRTREIQRSRDEISSLNAELQQRADDLEKRVAGRTADLAHLAARQQALAQIELAINQPHELRAVLDQIVAHVTGLLPASGGASVILWDETAGRFDQSSSTVSRQPASEAAHRARSAGGATRWIVDHRQPFVVADIRDDPFHANPMLAEYELRAYAGFPLLASGQVLGVLYALSREPRAYPPDDLDFLEAMAARAAAAILKVRLYQELADARDRAESADRLKSAFLATMSHELRTPLNSIIGFTGVLLQKIAGPLTAEQDKQLGIVRDSARHLLALINDVLDISKIEAGQLRLDCEPFDLRAALAQAGDIVRPLAARKGLDLRAEIAPSVGAWTGDERRLAQILINLLTNAVKFTEAGQVTLRADIRGDRLVLAVADTGIGIRPEDHEQIFQPFRQVDSGLGRRHEGTGLGLAICRRLAEKLGGTLAVESEPGKGSVFTLDLPAAGVPS